MQQFGHEELLSGVVEVIMGYDGGAFEMVSAMMNQTDEPPPQEWGNTPERDGKALMRILVICEVTHEAVRGYAILSSKQGD